MRRLKICSVVLLPALKPACSSAINNLRFADDIDGLAEEEEELANLVERLDKASMAYGMEISAEKTKQDTTHLIQRPCYQRGSPCQDPAGNWTT